MIFKQLFIAIGQTINPTEIDIPRVTPSTGDGGTIDTVLRVVFGIAGAIAVIMVTIGGLQYVLSQGNPQSTAKAKDTILYSLVGLVIVIFGYFIVGFVAGRVA